MNDPLLEQYYKDFPAGLSEVEEKVAEESKDELSEEDAMERANDKVEYQHEPQLPSYKDY